MSLYIANDLFCRLPPVVLVAFLALLVVVFALLAPLAFDLVAVTLFDFALLSLGIAGFSAGVSAKPNDCMIVSASGEKRPGWPVVDGDRIGVIPSLGLNNPIPFVVDHIASEAPGVGRPSIIFALK